MQYQVKKTSLALFNTYSIVIFVQTPSQSICYAITSVIIGISVTKATGNTDNLAKFSFSECLQKLHASRAILYSQFYIFFDIGTQTSFHADPLNPSAHQPLRCQIFVSLLLLASSPQH